MGVGPERISGIAASLPFAIAATAASEHIIANGERKAALATCKVDELTNWAAISRGLARRLKPQRGLRGQGAIAPQRDAGGLGGQKLSSRTRWTAGRVGTGWGAVNELGRFRTIYCLEGRTGEGGRGV